MSALPATLPPLVFDLDGTLIDSVPDIHAAINRMLGREGREAMTLAEVRSYVGDGAPVLVREVMAARGLDAARHSEITAAFVADYTARSAELTTVFPDVPEVLGQLRAAGHPLGICTNKPAAATQSVLSAFGLAPLFDVVIGGDTLPERKPDPAPLRAAMAALGGSGIFIGDSEVDAATAGAAALPFLLYTRGYLRLPRDRIHLTKSFDDFADLPDIVVNISETLRRSPPR